MTVQCALLKCCTILQHRDGSVNIPLPPEKYHCSDEAKWRIGVDGKTQILSLTSGAANYTCLFKNAPNTGITLKYKK